MKRRGKDLRRGKQEVMEYVYVCVGAGVEWHKMNSALNSPLTALWRLNHRVNSGCGGIKS